MSCQLGRVTGIESPNSIRQDGDTLRVGGEFAYANPVTATALAMQILGYPNVDEPVVPFIYSASQANGLLDGFYVVESTEVDFAKLAAGLFSWSAQLSKIPGWQVPLFEVLGTGAQRSNSHAITGLSWTAFPGSALSFDVLNSGAQVSLADGGTVWTASALTQYFNDPVLYSATTAATYEGAAKLTMNGSTVVGRQAVSDGDGWVVSNGIVKVRPSLTEANHIVVGIRNSGATDYDEKAYRLGNRSGGTSYERGRNGATRYAPLAVTVMRNAPECVSIRLTLRWGAASTLAGVASSDVAYHAYLDVTIRRGQTYAEFFLTIVDGSVPLPAQHGVWRGTVEAGTDITTGVEATAADASSNKYRIYTPRANTVDTTNGGVYIDTDSTTFPFAIGNDRSFLGGSVSFRSQYFGAQNHRQRIVAR